MSVACVAIDADPSGGAPLRVVLGVRALDDEPRGEGVWLLERDDAPGVAVAVVGSGLVAGALLAEGCRWPETRGSAPVSETSLWIEHGIGRAVGRLRSGREGRGHVHGMTSVVVAWGGAAPGAVALSPYNSVEGVALRRFGAAFGLDGPSGDRDGERAAGILIGAGLMGADAGARVRAVVGETIGAGAWGSRVVVLGRDGGGDAGGGCGA
jgi:hypothetical protein